MNKALLFFIALALSMSTYSMVPASDTTSVVVNMAGKVTVLLPGQKEAVEVKKGDRLPDDSSLLTQERSFVRVQYRDGSIINLAPNSKMVLRRATSDDNAGVISLVRGKIRSSVNKEERNNNKNKVIINTRMAALGVRGTEFIAVYNPENRATSLVTFDGEVAIVKKLEDTDDIEKIEEYLSQGESVKKGQFAGFNEKSDEAPRAVEIDPNQLNILKQAIEREVMSDGKEKRRFSAQGNVVDFNTATYLPGIGEIDGVSGVFIAPKGTELTTSGFVPENHDSRRSSNKARALNQIIGKAPVIHWLSLSPEFRDMRIDYSQGQASASGNDSVIGVTAEYSQIRGLNRYSLGYSQYSLNMEDKGCTNCATGYNFNGRAGSLMEFYAGYERNFFEYLKLGVELGYSQRPIIDISEKDFKIDKKGATRVGVNARFNTLNYKSTYIYGGLRLDKLSISGYDSGMGREYSIGIDRFFDNQDFGLTFEVFKGSEEYGDQNKIEVDKGGARLGIIYQFR